MKMSGVRLMLGALKRRDDPVSEERADRIEAKLFQFIVGQYLDIKVMKFIIADLKAQIAELKAKEQIDIPMRPLTTKKSPREELAADYQAIPQELPIRGGWGYTKEDACIIDRNDPIVDRGQHFDGVGIEYIFVEKRIYNELIIQRPAGSAYSDINWKLMKQNLILDNGRYYDHLCFEVTAYKDHDNDALRAEWFGTEGHAIPGFDHDAHQQKREACLVRTEQEFWFDISSFYGLGLGDDLYLQTPSDS